MDLGKVKYGVSRIIIFQVNPKNNQVEVLNYGFHAKQSAFTEIRVDNPKFFIYIECDYCLKDNLDLTISAYSSKPVVIDYQADLTKAIQTDNTKQLLTALLASFAVNFKKTSKPLEVKDFKSKNGATCKRYYGEMLGYVVFLYINESKSETLNEEYMVKELKNVEWFWPYDKNHKMKKTVSIGPGAVKAIILKFGWDNNCGHSSKINSGSTFK